MKQVSSSYSSDLFSILGSTESSPQFKSYLRQAFNVEDPTALESHSYPEIKYLNLKESGISFQFEPPKQQKGSEWQLAAIDIYNDQSQDSEEDEKKAKRKEKNPFRPFKFLPVRFSFTKDNKDAKSSPINEFKQLEISKETTGMDLVSTLGEPDRKAGGSSNILGPSSWLEWQLIVDLVESTERITLMCELSGKASRGSERWEKEKGGKSKWGVLTITKSSSE